jgi:hypothetical protein
MTDRTLFAQGDDAVLEDGVYYWTPQVFVMWACNCAVGRIPKSDRTNGLAVLIGFSTALNTNPEHCIELLTRAETSNQALVELMSLVTEWFCQLANLGKLPFTESKTHRGYYTEAFL